MKKTSKESWEEFIRNMNMNSVVKIDTTTTLSGSSAKAYNLLMLLEKERCEMEGVKFDLNAFHEFVLMGGVIKSLELHVSNLSKTLSNEMTRLMINTLQELGDK